MPDQALPDIPLPSGWAKNVKSAVLQVISLAHYAIVAARGWAANSITARVRLAADNDRLKQETQLLREELRIKDARMRFASIVFPKPVYAGLRDAQRPYRWPAGRAASIRASSGAHGP